MSNVTIKKISDLIKKGGIYTDYHGKNFEDIYYQVCRRIQLPEGVTSKELYESLISREKIMCTAIGHGFAIPHPIDYFFPKNEEKIVVVTSKEKLNMDSLDYEDVYVLFFLFLHDKDTLLQIASLLNMLFRDDSLLSVFNREFSDTYFRKLITQSIFKYGK